MKQIIFNSSGAKVIRMPRPAAEPGTVVVRVRYSMISVGTELASLRPPASGEAGASATNSLGGAAATAKRYLYKAVLDPKKAARRVAGIAKRATQSAAARIFPAKPVPPPIAVGELAWTQHSAKQWAVDGQKIEILTDDSPAGYQATTQPIAIPEGRTPIVELQGEILNGAVSVGFLNHDRSQWLGSRRLDRGPLDERIIIAAGDSPQATLVISNVDGGANSRIRIDRMHVSLAAEEESGLPLNEMDDQGWFGGYSVAGEVTAVGAGVDGFAVGDWVACAGAGAANHAEFVKVPVNLTCRLPAGCDPRVAATTTVGSIALQGVRRASPQLGETVAVLGLGLIGQITAQLLKANGCRVLGMDLDPARVARAEKLGLTRGASTPDEFERLVKMSTGGRGVDCTIMTAACKSSAVINSAMNVTRAKGRVVIVGDVGLGADRAAFYRKEIDLLMSTSYGPGRYDASYEQEGRDYPFGYVRWTLNRNMQAYLSLAAEGRIDIASLIDRQVPIKDAPALYRELTVGGAQMPLGVLIEYPDDGARVPDNNATRIALRGHRRLPKDKIRYALIGAGGFGTCMLVPKMDLRKDLFFLRGVVSRNGVNGSNFARSRQVEVLSTDLGDVLRDPDFDLAVIATRHCEHAAQVVACLQAGKHVFVEKPLALTWEELDRVEAAHREADGSSLIMVGFNRRFSPAVLKLQEIIARRMTPLVIHYRVNGGYIPLDHWVQGRDGGGRNLGEACHMYDTFRAIVGSPVASVQARAINPADLPYLRTDNFTAALSYGDGSLANLVYTSLGPKQGLPKERIEVFVDGEAYVIDDFKSLTRCSDGAVLWSSAEADKGHAEELSRFGEAIAQGGAAPIPFEQLIETSAVALHVNELLLGKDAENVDEN